MVNSSNVVKARNPIVDGYCHGLLIMKIIIKKKQCILFSNKILSASLLRWYFRTDTTNSDRKDHAASSVFKNTPLVLPFPWAALIRMLQFICPLFHKKS